MNKTIFFTGAIFFGIELVGLLIYLLTTINYSWLNFNFIIWTVSLTIFGLINIDAFIFLIVGALIK